MQIWIWSRTGLRKETAGALLWDRPGDSDTCHVSRCRQGRCRELGFLDGRVILALDYH